MGQEGDGAASWWSAAFTQELSESLSAFDDIDDPGFRGLVLKGLGGRLGFPGPFPAKHHDYSRDHVRAIVYACRDYNPQATAVAQLVAAMQDLRPEVRALDRLERCLHAINGTAASYPGAGPIIAVSQDNSLSPDVQDAYRQKLSCGPATIDTPVRWTLDELSRLRQEVVKSGLGPSKQEDALTALCEAVRAKQVFLALGGGGLELGHLQVTYRREISAWPDGLSADALLVEAASVTITEGTSRAWPLGALARFLVGVAAALETPPQENDLMARWIGSPGPQGAGAQRHYSERRDKPAWLLIDLGDEPRTGDVPWPTTVTWTRLTRDDLMVGEPIRCDATADDLRRALSDVLRLAPPARPLLVDLAVPRALMDVGIEHWPILKIDGKAEPLSADCHPRLRWSRRRRDPWLHNRLLDRVAQGSWEGNPKQWLRLDPRHACFLGGHDEQSRTDPLRVLLRDGYGFVIWFPAGLADPMVRQIARAVRKVPTLARGDTLPVHLPPFSENHPAIIWDDPRGRAEFRLPPLVVPEF